MIIGKTFRFESSHQLLYHDGKCRNLHGHSYKLEVIVEGPVRQAHAMDPQSGMVIDFYHLSDIWKNHLEPYLDHPLDENSLAEYVSERDQVPPIYPTAENMAMLIHNEFQRELAKHEVTLIGVKLWETETSYASTI